MKPNKQKNWKGSDMIANLDLFLDNEACREAWEKAFSQYYSSGEFIEDLDEFDMRDLLRKMWAERIAPKMGTRPIDVITNRFSNVVAPLDVVATNKCTAYADDNWNDPLGG